MSLFASCGVTMTPDHSRALQRFLGDVLQLDHSLPVEQAMRRAGWDGDAPILPGVRRLVPDDRWLRGYYSPDATDDDAARATWADVIRMSAQYPKVALALGAAVGSLYASALGAGASNVHLVGDSRKGKTQTMRAAVAIFGTDDLIMTWDTTPIALGSRLETAAILPVFLDETGAANMRDEQLAAWVFRAAGGKGRQRANRDGSIRAVGSWANVNISTGERGLVAASALTGARPRVLEVHAPMTPGRGSIDALVDLATSHPGAPARWLVQHPRLDVARTVYARVQAMLDDTLGGDSIDRTLSRNAAVYVTGFVMLATVANVVDVLTADLIDGAAAVLRESLDAMRDGGTTTGERLLRAIIEDMAVHQSRWDGSDPRETAGWRATDHVVYALPATVQRLARAMGLEDATPALRGLRDSGQLISGDGRNLAKMVKRSGVGQRVYALKVTTGYDSESGMSEPEEGGE